MAFPLIYAKRFVENNEKYFQTHINSVNRVLSSEEKIYEKRKFILLLAKVL